MGLSPEALMQVALPGSLIFCGLSTTVNC